MTTRKFVRFGAPYRSKTFNDTHNFMVGANGVLNGGEVTTSGPVVTIQPVTFVQQGLIVDVNTPISITLPLSGLEAPYYIAVSVSTSVENLAEAITPVFIKRPSEAAENVCLIAEWDGQEWRNLPKLQAEQIIKDEQKRSVAEGIIGIGGGMEATQDGSNIYIAPGNLVAKDGTYASKKEIVSLPKLGMPITGQDRVDNVVFRKPNDSEFRIGTTQYVTGPSYHNTNPIGLSALTNVDASTGLGMKQLLKKSTGEIVLTYIDGTNLMMCVFAADLTTITLLPLIVATNVESYDACLNAGGSVDFTYVKSSVTLFYQRMALNGSVLYTESAIHNAVVALHTPKIICVGNAVNSFLHIAVCKNTGGSSHEIGYIRLNNSNGIDTQYVSWVNLTANLRGPYLEKDDEDMELYLGFDNADTGRAYFRVYDAGTATASTPPQIIGSPVELQNEVYNMNTLAVASTTGAIEVKIKRTANKETYVFWKHFLGAGQYAIAVWNSKFKANLGYKAYIERAEVVTAYDVDIDGMNRAYYAVVTQAAPTVISKYVLRLLDLQELQAPQNVVVGATFSRVTMTFHTLGDLFYFFTTPTQTRAISSTAYIKVSLRDQELTDTDLYLAHYRASDSMLASSGLAMEEAGVFKRLYEYFNCFLGASGKVSWNITGVNTLTFSSDVVVRFFNRVSTYTIPAGNVVIPANHVCYVTIPDDDVNTSLTVDVVQFGDGILDREGRKDFPIFWNIGGNLYMRFAPYRLASSGESGDIGEGVSDELLAWLGASSVNPDPSNHGYGSTSYILESDSHNTAIGKLDNASGQTRTINLMDLVSTSLPTGPTATIDGVSLIDGHVVIFTQAPIAGAYTVSGVGTSIVFTPLLCFKGLNTPYNGAIVRVTNGTNYLATLWTFTTEWKVIETSSATGENTGTVDKSQSTISFNNANREFTIAPVGTHFDFIIHNVLFRKGSAQAIPLPNTDGIKHIYFDNTGTIQYQNAFDESLIRDKAYIATVYWNVALGAGIMADERHGIIMDYNTHAYLHNTQGAKIQSGFSPVYTTAGTGAVDADCELAISNGIIRDEDLMHDIQDGVQQDLAPVAQVPVFYRSGVTGVWTWDATTNVPLKAGTLRPKFNNPTGWTTDDASADGKFIAMFIVVTNFYTNPVIAVMGQAEYDSLSDAQAGAIYQNLLMGDFLTQEAKLAYRLIFETSNAFGNTIKASLRDVQDYRAGADLHGTPAASVTDHGLLTGLADPDHPPTAVTTAGVVMDGGLSASDTDLENVLDTLNKTLGQLRLKPHPSNNKRVVVTGAKRVLNSGTALVQKIKNFVMSFDGAEIDFATKQIFAADGTTPFPGGAAFTYTYPAAAQWKWLAITAAADAPTGLNETTIKFMITEAASTAASQALAPKATFASGIGVGQIAVQGNGVDVSAITAANINSIGVAGGGGGSGGASPKIIGGGTLSVTNVDEGFNIGTGFDNLVYSSLVQPDGKIIAAGSFTLFNSNPRNRLVRLDANGVEDTAFYANLGTGFSGGTTVEAVAIQPDGKILVCGNFIWLNGNTRRGIVRLNSSGAEDTSFYTNIGTGIAGGSSIRNVAVQSDGKIVFVGGFTQFNGNSISGITRLNANGSEDSAFRINVGGGAAGEVKALAIQADGKILVGGYFTLWSGNTRNRLVRLNADGTEDTLFYSALGTGFDNVVSSVVVQPDGKILVAGGFDTVNGVTKRRLIRLNSDGSVDTSFFANIGTGFNNSISGLALQPDGKIIVCGSFLTFNGNLRNRLVRLNADGTEDTAFYTNLGTSFDDGLASISIRQDGRILITGIFSSFNGNPRYRMVSLLPTGIEETTTVISDTLLDYTSDFHVEVPGLAYADNTIQTALSPITFTADQQAAYVVPNSSTGGPALPVTVTTLPNVPSDAVILARREGTEVIVGSSSTRLSNGESKKLYAGVSDQLLSSLPATSNADNTGQLRLLANSAPNKKVNVSAVSKIVPDGTEYGIQIKNLLLSFGGAIIDFSTGVITDQLGGALGVNFTPATIAASQYRWYSVTLVPANIEANGKISGQLVVIAGASDGATAALAPRAAFATGIQLGQVVVQESGGSIAVIPQSNIIQLSAGGSGSGTGDANSLMEDIKARLRDGPFMWATPNIISLQGKTLIDAVNSTATYDIANSWYDIDIGQSLRSTQQFGAQFLASTRDCQDVEVNLGYDTTGVDPNPSVYVSRNGGNAWQQVTMDRVGASNKLHGSLTFTAEADQIIDTYAIANANGAAILNNTNYKAVAQKFEPTSKVLIRKLTFRFEKVGSPTGNVNLKIIKDVAGSPSADLNDIVYATTMSASSFAAGSNNRSFTMNVPLPSASYWFVFDTDDLYKTGYTGSNNIRIYQDSSTPTATPAKGYNTSWVTQVFAVVYIVEGLTYDLRLRVDSSINNSRLLGYGIFFGKQSPGDVVSSSTLKQMRTTFSGSDNVYSFTLPFLPDPDFLRVYDVKSCQVYVYPAFDISENTVSFVSGTFLNPGEVVTLVFDQSMGTGYDNSDRNRALMAENGLGGQNGNDASSPGVGIKLRSPNGQLWHIVVQDSGALLTTPITG